jgi:hypothetical protein
LATGDEGSHALPSFVDRNVRFRHGAIDFRPAEDSVCGNRLWPDLYRVGSLELAKVSEELDSVAKALLEQMENAGGAALRALP